jgi:hypothetical protein
MIPTNPATSPFAAAPGGFIVLILVLVIVLSALIDPPDKTERKRTITRMR